MCKEYLFLEEKTQKTNPREDSRLKCGQFSCIKKKESARLMSDAIKKVELIFSIITSNCDPSHSLISIKGWFFKAILA